MRVLCSAVLAMESILMGFALLIAKDQATLGQIWLGIAVAVLLLMTSGMLRRKVGFLLGSMLQIFVIGYGYVIPLMFYLGGLFAILWVAAIYLGRKGEAIKAAKVRASDKASPKKR